MQIPKNHNFKMTSSQIVASILRIEDLYAHVYASHAFSSITRNVRYWCKGCINNLPYIATEHICNLPPADVLILHSVSVYQCIVEKEFAWEKFLDSIYDEFAAPHFVSSCLCRVALFSLLSPKIAAKIKNIYPQNINQLG